MVTRGWRRGRGEAELRGLMYSVVITADNTVSLTWKLLRVDIKCSPLKKKWQLGDARPVSADTVVVTILQRHASTQQMGCVCEPHAVLCQVQLNRGSRESHPKLLSLCSTVKTHKATF